MSSPVKPWERPGVNNQQASLPPSNASSGVGELSAAGVIDTGGGGDGTRNLPAVSVAQPPPLPSRSSVGPSYGAGYNTLGYTGGIGGIGSTYSGLGYGGYSGLGSYGGMYGSSMYGGYGSYNRYGYGDMGQNSFVRMAEENSRQAFQSIEGIVQAFGSVAMMLESTYSAVYNSFRAVIGVADHFSRMRTHFAQMFSAFAVIKTLRWLYRRLLVLLRLREGGLQEDVWSAAAQTMGEAAAGVKGGDPKIRANWPLSLFFAVIIGGPYLIWKFLSSISGKSGTGWASGEDDHFVAEALFDFTAQNDDEVSLRQGQSVNIAPKELQPQIRGWLLGSVNGTKMGIIPTNYIKIIGKRRGTKNRPAAVPVDKPPKLPSSESNPQTVLESCSQSGLDFPVTEITTGSLQHNSMEKLWTEEDSDNAK